MRRAWIKAKAVARWSAWHMVPGVLGAALAVLMVAGGIGGCPRLPPVEGCVAGAQRCHAETPQVCSATGRWHPIGNTTCTAVGGVCVEGLSAHCAPGCPAGGERCRGSVVERCTGGRWSRAIDCAEHSAPGRVAVCSQEPDGAAVCVSDGGAP